MSKDAKKANLTHFLVVSHDYITGCVRSLVHQLVHWSVGNAFVSRPRQDGEQLISCLQICFGRFLYLLKISFLYKKQLLTDELFTNRNLLQGKQNPRF